LTPILCAEPWLGELAGLTIPDASLTIVPRSDAPPESLSKQAILQSSRGSLLFTHAGLSGPVGLNVSRAISRSSTPTDLMALADFLPGLTLEEFRQQLATRLRDDGRRQVSSILAERLPRSLALTLLMIAQVPAERRGAELNKRELAAISRTAKHCPIHPLGTAGFLKAEVTAGGVSLEEVDSRTMQSKLVPNLFFAGEVLDIDGPIGGFNFQAAFSTGWLAGSCMAR
jgi:predicted Rossmann fold flavoprotein